jgi:hypothetical protein
MDPPAKRPGRPKKRTLIPGEVRAKMTPQERARLRAREIREALARAPKRDKVEPLASGLTGFHFPEAAASEIETCRSPAPSDEFLLPDELDDVRRVQRIFRFIRKQCRVPEGRLMGRRMVIEEWQRSAIRAIYGNPHVTRRAIISMARKNGKTSFVAALLLAHLIGPEAKGNANSQLYSAAQSRDQAALIFNAACKIINQNIDMRDAIKITESHKALTNIDLNIRYRALAADATTAFGLSPRLIIHDELGQICPRKQIKRLQNMGFQTAA